MGRFEQMGYYRLRKILTSRPGGMSVVASEAEVDLNRMYNLTGKNPIVREHPPYFTPDERERIMAVIGKDTHLTEREVFEFYEDSDSKFFQGIPTRYSRNRR